MFAAGAGIHGNQREVTNMAEKVYTLEKLTKMVDENREVMEMVTGIMSDFTTSLRASSGLKATNDRVTQGMEKLTTSVSRNKKKGGN